MPAKTAKKAENNRKQGFINTTAGRSGNLWLHKEVEDLSYFWLLGQPTLLRKLVDQI